MRRVAACAQVPLVRTQAAIRARVASRWCDSWYHGVVWAPIAPATPTMTAACKQVLVAEARSTAALRRQATGAVLGEGRRRLSGADDGMHASARTVVGGADRSSATTAPGQSEVGGAAGKWAGAGDLMQKDGDEDGAELGSQLYCTGLPLSWNRDELRLLFEPLGTVSSVKVPQNVVKRPDGTSVKRSRGFGFVEFENPAHLLAAARQLDGHELPDGRSLRIKIQGSGRGSRSSPSRPPALQRAETTPSGPGSETKVTDIGLDAATVRSGTASDAQTTVDAMGGVVGSTEAASGNSSAPADQAGKIGAKSMERVANPKKSGQQQKRMKQADAKLVKITEGMTIKSLCEEMGGTRLVDVIKTIIKLGEEPQTINDPLKAEIAEIVVSEHGMLADMPKGAESLSMYRRSFSDEEYAALPMRAPIVTVMGHVDHGKTSLLDYLRATSVAAGEAGGITQSIAAFEVERPGLGRICFIDTPGHQAFGAMRERGARVTDIVVLVVAASDGVMPQTIEVIQHSRAAQVPLVIAVNKCDLPDADPDKVLEELQMHGVVVEALGGDVQSVNISALTGLNVDKLEEAVALMAEMMELRAPEDGAAEGVVIESRKDKGLGDVASVIVHMGQLVVGDYMVAGPEWGRVRALRDAAGNTVKSVGPSSVVDVVGFRGHPTAGDELLIVPSEKTAVALAGAAGARKAKADSRLPLATAALPADGGERGVEEVPIMVKADVDGSLEAIVGSLMALPRQEVALKIVSAEIGQVTEHDVQIAATAGADIYTFNCRSPSAAVKKLITSLKVNVKAHRIIYDLLDDVTRVLVGRLPPDVVVEELSLARVLQVFEMKGKGTVAGCSVENGTFVANAFVRVERDGQVLHEGKVASLHRNKDAVSEIGSGSECGILLESFSDFEPGDVLRCIQRESRVRTSL